VKKSENSSLQKIQKQKGIMINHKGTRIAKDGEE